MPDQDITAGTESAVTNTWEPDNLGIQTPPQPDPIAEPAMPVAPDPVASPKSYTQKEYVKPTPEYNQASATYNTAVSDEEAKRKVFQENVMPKMLAETQQVAKQLKDNFDQMTEDAKAQKGNLWDAFSNASTGRQVAAGLGILFGAIGSGLTGKSNAALDAIQQNIDNEYNSRKKRLENMMSMAEKSAKLGGQKQMMVDQLAEQLKNLEFGETEAKTIAAAQLFADKTGNTQALDLVNARLKTNVAKRVMDRLAQYNAKMKEVHFDGAGGGTAIKPSRFQNAVQQKQATDYANLVDKEQKVAADEENVNRAYDSFVNYSKNSLGGTGGWSTLGGATKYISQPTQQLDAQFKELGLSKMVSMFAGMSKAVDSDAERRAFESTIPSITQDDAINYERLLGTKAIIQRNKLEINAQRDFVNKNGNLNGYESPNSHVSSVVDESGNIVLIPRGQAIPNGLMPVDKYVSIKTGSKVNMPKEKASVNVVNKKQNESLPDSYPMKVIDPATKDVYTVKNPKEKAEFINEFIKGKK
jgi:hypothetical protein